MYLALEYVTSGRVVERHGPPGSLLVLEVRELVLLTAVRADEHELQLVLFGVHLLVELVERWLQVAAVWAPVSLQHTRINRLSVS